MGLHALLVQERYKGFLILDYFKEDWTNKQKDRFCMFQAAFLNNCQEYYNKSELTKYELSGGIVQRFDYLHLKIVNKPVFKYKSDKAKVNIKDRLFVPNKKVPNDFYFFDSLHPEVQKKNEKKKINYDGLLERIGGLEGEIRFFEFPNNLILRIHHEKIYAVSDNPNDREIKVVMLLVYDKDDEDIQSKRGDKLVPWVVEEFEKILLDDDTLQLIGRKAEGEGVDLKHVRAALKKKFEEYEIFRKDIIKDNETMESAKYNLRRALGLE